MILEKVCVENFRSLRNFETDFKKDLSLIVGRNNCGKTSILSIMNKFLNSNSSYFDWNDFNLKYQNKLFKELSSYEQQIEGLDGIIMTMYISYTEKDNYANLQKFMMDLNPENNIVVIEFNYNCKTDKVKELKDKLKDLKISTKNDENKFIRFMKKNHDKYFTLDIYACGYDLETQKKNTEKSALLKKSDVANFINFKSIKANRDASNKSNDNSLSTLSSKFLKLKEGSESSNLDALENAINDADEALTEVYNTKIFHDIIKSIKRFGGNQNETKVKITSTLQEKELLSGNTTLLYEYDGKQLPENYNGLGYLNLISMIFEIEAIITDFMKNGSEKPADINLLFIEEPEAHTHPQLQYIFIKNIKNLIKDGVDKLKKSRKSLGIQTIISTHSSHIVSDSELDDILYFKRDDGEVSSKKFENLAKEYENDTKAFHFVKKYLNLSRSELFFADKAIFIEGDTERILLPSMMKKIDKESTNDNILPLLSQNISIIEVGAYAHKFKPLIDFFGIKTLIITDIDSADIKNIGDTKKNGDKYTKKTIIGCSPAEAKTSTNQSILALLRDKLPNKENEIFKTLTALKESDKIINDNIRIAYQVMENDYQANSFEDAFICTNYDYIFKNKENFNQNLKNIGKINNTNKDYYGIAKSCIEKKSVFATEILYYDGQTDGETWKTPLYIKEGLEWLKNL